jgi:hypothetical protein
MLIAEALDEEALHTLRKRGAFLALTSSMLGDDVARDLRSLVNTIENAAAAVATNPDSVFELISRLSRIEGASLNLRGIVLEMIVAHLYKLSGYSIEIRQQARGEDGGLSEIDVKSTNAAELVCCECKGMSPGRLVDEDDILEWLNGSLARIKHFLQRIEGMPASRRFEFYSSTGYTEKARSLIAETESRHRGQPIKFFNGSDVVARLQEYNQTALVRIFREQFIQR